MSAIYESGTNVARSVHSGAEALAESGTSVAVAKHSGVERLVPAVVGSVMTMAGVRVVAHAAPPEPGYHLVHDHHDVLGGAIVFGIAVAALYTTFRAVIDPKEVL